MDNFIESYYEVQHYHKHHGYWYALTNFKDKTRLSKEEAKDMYEEMKDAGYKVRVIHIQKEVVCLSRGILCQQ